MREHEVGIASVVQVVKFKGPPGRAVFNAIFTRNKAQANELFLPGRTAFVFNLEEGTLDVPTTLRRAAADCPPVMSFL